MTIRIIYFSSVPYRSQEDVPQKLHCFMARVVLRLPGTNIFLCKPHGITCGLDKSEWTLGQIIRTVQTNLHILSDGTLPVGHSGLPC
jgi:hypothetical protein